MSTLRDTVRDIPEEVFFDVLGNEAAYLLVLDVPGVDAEGLEYQIEANRLEITAHRTKPADDEYEYLEENRPMLREFSLTLPDDVVADGVEATVDRGVLELQLPKEEDSPASASTADSETTADSN